MSSPFQPYTNTTFTFTVASGAIARDPQTGNMLPGTTTVEVSAVMKQVRDPNRDRLPGVDETAVYLEGFLVEPRPLPASITPDSRCTAVWDDKRGTFNMVLTGRNPYLKAVGIDLVDQIKGYFKPSSFVGTPSP